MKASKKIRVLRALAIAGSLSALVVPTAVAKPVNDIPYNSGQQAYQLPSSFHSEAQTSTPAEQPFSLPSRFRSEIQTPAAAQPQPQPYNLPASFRPEVQTPSSPTVASAPGSIVREIRTVTDNGSPTLAIVLAALALAIALSGMAYGWVRLTRMQRSMSSRALVG
jgi:hypothetical protein